VITEEFDVLRDGGEAYALKLMHAGVPVTAKAYRGLSSYSVTRVFGLASVQKGFLADNHPNNS
jgi:acetyl esterase/lipase